MKPSGFSLGAAHGVRKRKSSGDVVGGGAMEGGGGCLCYSSGRCLCDASLLGICWGVLCTALAPRRGGSACWAMGLGTAGMCWWVNLNLLS